MIKTKQGYGARPYGPMASPFNSALNFHRLFGTTAKVQTSGWQQVIRMNRECLDFLNRRLEADRELVTDLADVKVAAEAWSAWAEFYQNARRDYVQEARRFAKFFADGARAATADIQEQFGETAAVATNAAFTVASATKAGAQ